MQTKYKIVLIVLAVALAAALVSWFLIKRQKATPQTTTSPTQTAVVSPVSSATGSVAATALADWHIYTNVQFSFRVTFTNVWKDYKAESAAKVADAAAACFDITLASTDKNLAGASGRVAPVTYCVYTPENWAKVKGKNRQNELLAGPKYVYTYSTWEQTPSDWQVLTEKEIADVNKTFKVLP